MAPFLSKFWEESSLKKELIRNIAIIAHVDHGKTTLVDKMLMQTGNFRSNEKVVERVMDSNDLEKEKGITILAKNTAVDYGDYRINIIDTPGHADFGGEVERIMKMVDGVLLVIDAYEGCMPQTKFVLKKALEEQLKPIVVINKMDRDYIRPSEVIDEVIDLFIELGADDDQLDFPVLYASGIQGIASTDQNDLGTDLDPLFKEIISYIPNPVGLPDNDLQLQITLLDYSDFLGKIGIGVVRNGSIKLNMQIEIAKNDGKTEKQKVTKLFSFSGLKRTEVEFAEAGQIVAIAGVGEINVGDTLCEPGKIAPLERVIIEEPTLQMNFLVNDAPFAGKDGDPYTARKLEARLLKEMHTDVSLKVEKTDKADVFSVAGRGELHLAVIIEKLRREGIEFQVSRPQIIVKEIDGVKMEPYELLIIETPEDYLGAVMDLLSRKKADLIDMTNINGNVKIKYEIPSRGVIGLRTDFLTETRGYGILTHSFIDHRPMSGEIGDRKNGVLVSWETGTATSYALQSAEERGTLFIDPGTDVYEGMIVGENKKDEDLTINVCKQKQLTNVRSSSKDDAVKLKGKRSLSLEQSLAYLAEDEYLEITPKTYRLRKIHLSKNERDKQNKYKKYESLNQQKTAN